MADRSLRTGATVRELLREACRDLAHLESAHLDAELLLAQVLGIRREGLYAHPELEATEPAALEFRALIGKRRTEYPVAYLIGRRGFWNLDLEVTPATLIPRPETELIVAAALEQIPAQAAWRILDLGTGSGAIALAIASERPACTVYATDIDPKTLATAEVNRAAGDLPNVHLQQVDWLINFGETAFDLILSNPPYVASGDPALYTGETAHEPRLALDGGVDGLGPIRRIIPAAFDHLKIGACLMLEHGATQGAAVRALLAASGYQDPETLRDLAGHERVSLGNRP
jgi:release factor glutamine methyltransferase